MDDAVRRAMERIERDIVEAIGDGVMGSPALPTVSLLRVVGWDGVVRYSRAPASTSPTRESASNTGQQGETEVQFSARMARENARRLDEAKADPDPAAQRHLEQAP